MALKSMLIRCINIVGCECVSMYVTEHCNFHLKYAFTIIIINGTKNLVNKSKQVYRDDTIPLIKWK